MPKKYTKIWNSEILETYNGKTMLLTKCSLCGSEKSRFIKKQEAKGLLSNLGPKTLLSKIPLLGDIVF